MTLSNLMSDWRLQGQDRYLQGVSLTHKRYKKYSEKWEHDHCEFCGQKFSESSGTFSVGYATDDDYHWICESCFADFRQQFQWSVKEKCT